jgi:hypothetical protein
MPFAATKTGLKVQLPLRDGKPTSDCGLWLCRLEAMLEAKGLAHAIQASNETSLSVSDITSGADPEAALQLRKASSIIVNGLGDKPLRNGLL